MFQASNMTYMRRREAEKKVVLQTIHRHQLVFTFIKTLLRHYAKQVLTVDPTVSRCEIGLVG